MTTRNRYLSSFEDLLIAQDTSSIPLSASCPGTLCLEGRLVQTTEQPLLLRRLFYPIGFPSLIGQSSLDNEGGPAVDSPAPFPRTISGSITLATPVHFEPGHRRRSRWNKEDDEEGPSMPTNHVTLARALLESQTPGLCPAGTWNVSTSAGYPH